MNTRASFTNADWDAVPSYMFSADEDRPVEPCYCRSCRSQGFYDQDNTCRFYLGDQDDDES